MWQRRTVRSQTPGMPETLENVYVNAEGLVFRHGRIYMESFALPHYAEAFSGLQMRTRFLVKNHLVRRGAHEIPSALWAIDNVSANYFHWHVETLTRLLRAEQQAANEHVLVLPRHYRGFPFVTYTLQAFPQIERVAWVGRRSKVRVRRLVHVPRLPKQPPERLPATEELKEVVRRISDLTGEAGPERRIYFSREGARQRRTVNEKDVLRVLREHDVEVIGSDHAKPWEQVQASRGATLAVGVHGAALANVMFMPPGARLLELRHPERHWDVYNKLADMFGVGYSSQTCRPAGDNHDVSVDLDELRENLRAAGG